MAIDSYRDLILWLKAMDVVEIIHQVTKQFPREETYGLTDQFRLAEVSIPSSIAEGQEMKSTGDFNRFNLTAEGRQMMADSASVSKSEKTQAIKKQLEDYENTLFEVAARKIDIDLDDGVKQNYQLFSSVLRKIPGLDAKDD